METPVEDFFVETSGEPTIFVVSLRFAVSRGHQYFKQFEGTKNYVVSHDKAESCIARAVQWIFKKTPDVGALVQQLFFSDSLDINAIVEHLSKLFTVEEHQAAGPEVIDPIIIQEGTVTKVQIGQIIALHKNSILRPTIIIMLKDNNFNRARELLGMCPNGLTVKFVDNSGISSTEMILNTGAENVEEFLRIYARQCFNACSRTKSGIITNEEWAGDSVIRELGPILLKSRSLLLHGEKQHALADVNSTLLRLQNMELCSGRKRDVAVGIKCIANLFRVFCNDYGPDEMDECRKIASDLSSEILQAHVDRYSYFIRGTTHESRDPLLRSAEEVFRRNNMEDHSVYCENNRLMRYFYCDEMSALSYAELVNRAAENVPGLVGMPILLNNTGAALIYEGCYEDAVRYLKRGLRHFPQQDHRIGLMSNLLIAKQRAGDGIDERDVRNVIDSALCLPPDLHFLSAHFILNGLAAVREQPDLLKEFTENPEVSRSIQSALTPQCPGHSSLSDQLNYLADKNDRFQALAGSAQGRFKTSPGRRGRFIKTTGMNPTILNAWL